MHPLLNRHPVLRVGAFAAALLLTGRGATAVAQPITYNGDLSAGCAPVTPGVSSQILSLSGPAALNETVIISASAAFSIPQVVAVGATDTALTHNTFTVDFPFLGSGPPFPATFLVSSRITTALTTSDAISLTWSNPTGVPQVVCAIVSDFSNLLAGGFDAFGAASGFSPAPLATTSGSTTQANELVIGVTGAAPVSPGFAPGAGYAPTISTITSAACTPVPLCAYSEWKVVSVTGSQTADGALTGGPGAWSQAVATYKGTVVPVELQRIRIE